MSATAVFIDSLESADTCESLAGAPGVEYVVQMAHDLRSPLSSILVLAEALQNGQSGPVTSAQKQQLGLIYTAALSLCASASDMIDMARSGEGLAHERPSPFSVSDVLTSVRDMVQPMVDERDLDLRVVYPVLDRREGRARALARVLLNLTTNALKSTDAGFVEIAVREVSDNLRRVECSVQDTGCGMKPAVLRSIFGRSSRSNVALRQQLTSSGLGLATCRRLVKAMGSTLRVETRADQGSRFSFELGLPPAACRV
jgi:signal transduction histidine kinase